MIIWAPSVRPSVRPSVFPSVRDLSVRINISDTNEYFFLILYKCINYNPPMNPVKCRHDQTQNGRLITIFVCSNWPNIWHCCLYGWISPKPMNISSWYSTHALITILPWILWSVVRIKFKMAHLSPFLFAQKLTKYYKKIVRPDEYPPAPNTNEYFLWYFTHALISILP